MFLLVYREALKHYDKLRFDGISFMIYVDDHPPAHVHGRYAETAVVLHLLWAAESRSPVVPRRSDRRTPSKMTSTGSCESLWKTNQLYDNYGAAYTEIPKMTDEELEAPLDPENELMIDAALERAKSAPDPVLALSAHFDTTNRLLVVLLSTGQRLAIPQEDLQYLADAGPDAASEVSIEMLGMGLHWEKLDLDFSVEGLSEGRRGNAAWMTSLQQRWLGKTKQVLQVA